MDKMERDQYAFARRVKHIHRSEAAQLIKEPLRELHAAFEQAVVDHFAKRGADASTGYGSNSATVADSLLRFYVWAVVGEYEP